MAAAAAAFGEGLTEGKNDIKENKERIKDRRATNISSLKLTTGGGY
jgi:hypothetical protein